MSETDNKFSELEVALQELPSSVDKELALSHIHSAAEAYRRIYFVTPELSLEDSMRKLFSNNPYKKIMKDAAAGPWVVYKDPSFNFSSEEGLL